jgi:UDPglucose 6-dehydrogenase
MGAGGAPMNICVFGLWHLGCVTAACFASVGHQVTGLDFDEAMIAKLNAGQAPVFEPQLDSMIQRNLAAGNLSFTTDIDSAVSNSEILLVTYDTPVDDDDVANVDFVITCVEKVLPKLPAGALVLVSSQLPVGSVAKLEAFAKMNHPELALQFACSPENLRLGKAMDVFLNPDRIVLGVRSKSAKDTLMRLWSPVTERLEWMSIESAEMTKHAINAFLATSVTFANEVAAICELVGADAREVARGVKSDARIGLKAYLSPGGAFAGGTLARDIVFLGETAQSLALTVPLLSSVKPSNDAHKLWEERRFKALFPLLNGINVMVWGLTYKPGTSTLRRSRAVALCQWLLLQGVKVHMHDPMVEELPIQLQQCIRHADPASEVQHFQAIVVATEWPQYREVNLQALADKNPSLTVLDANRFVSDFSKIPGLRYFSVGAFVEHTE